MKTKQTLLLIGTILLTTLVSLPAHSQIRIGAKAGVDLGSTALSDVLKVENLTSYHVGPAVEIMFPFSKIDFGIDVALLYNDNRMEVSNLTGESEKESISNRYLTLPLNAKLKFPLGGEAFKLYVLGGPYAGYLISGDKIDLSQMGDEIKAKEFEAGLNLGVGFEILKMAQIGVNYKVKLTDNYSAGKDNWNDPLNDHSNTLSVSLGVFF